MTRGREDLGPGDTSRFPVEDLERQFQLDGELRIRGDALNDILNVKRYDPNAWYVVTNDEEGVRKL